MKEYDSVVVFDGTGCEYTGFVEKIDEQTKTVTIGIIKTERPSLERAPEIHLAQSLPKKSKMDYVVEKATELGASRILPIISERTLVRPDKSSAERKVSRWKRIAAQTSKQCGRYSVPHVSKIASYKDIIKKLDQYDVVLLACLSGDTMPLKDSLSGFKSGKVLVLIGPEGDFSPGEVSDAARDNCRRVSLGQRVLKSDTAGLFVLSVLGYELSQPVKDDD